MIWHNHTTNECPVDRDAMVFYHLAGEPPTEVHGPSRADHVHWGPGVGPEGEGRIDQYAVWERR